MDLTKLSTPHFYTVKFEHYWIIHNFSNLLSENSSSFIFSESFPPQNDEFQFSLRLQPKYVDEEGNSYVSIFLQLRQCIHSSLKTTYRILLFNHGKNATEFIVKEEKDVDFSSGICRGFSDFILHEKLLPSFGNILTILCQITINCENELKIDAPKSSSTFKASENVIKLTHKWIVDDFSNFYYDNLDKKEGFLKLNYASSQQNDKLVRFYPILVINNENKQLIDQTKQESASSYVSLYLHFESNTFEEAMVSYRLSILNWKNVFYVTGEGHEKFISKGEGKGPKYFIKCDELMDLRNGLLRKDQLTIFARMETSELLTAKDKKYILEKVAKLTKLKKLIIDWWILKEISADDWNEYEIKNDIKWIKREGLKILLSDEVMEMIEDKSEEELKIIFEYFINQSPWLSRRIQHPLVQLCTSMSNRVHLNCDQWNIHRVVCWVVGWMAMEWGEKWIEDTRDCLVHYLAKIIKKCPDMKMVKWIILAFEEWWLKTTFHSSTKCQLVSALSSHTSYLLQVNISSDYESADLERYQVGWCAQWAIDNVLGDEEMRKKKQMPLIKLSPDRCEVRNDSGNYYKPACHKFIPVCSSFAVTSGVYYYEVIQLTDGEMRFGWATREAKLCLKMKIGDDKHSIGLELRNGCPIYHNDQIYSSTILTPDKSPNVIGCLIDTPNRQFQFYVNGQQVKLPDNVLFSACPYYATVSLGNEQECKFNLGQAPFKFPPKDIEFSDFSETSGKIPKYELTETNFAKNTLTFRFVNHVIATEKGLQPLTMDSRIKPLESVMNEIMSNKNYENFVIESPDNSVRIDENLIAQRHAEYIEERKRTGKKYLRLISKSFWLWLIGVVRNNMDKEPLFWSKLFNEANLAICVNALKEYLDIDLSETISEKLISEIWNELKQIMTRWLSNPKDTLKFQKDLECFYNDRVCKLITDGIIKQDWIDILLELTLMQKKDYEKQSKETSSFLDTFKTHFKSFRSAFYDGLDSGIEFLLKFDNDDLMKLKTTKQMLEGIENKYDHVETFEARVTEYGEIVKAIKHKTDLYKKSFDENDKNNLMDSINDDVNNFRAIKRKLNKDINSTLQELEKVHKELMEHRYRMRTVKTLPFITILIGVFLNSLSDNQKKKKEINGALVANMTERSSAMIESITDDWKDIFEQKDKVMGKMELVKKVKANFTGWHQIEKDCHEFLNKNI